MPTPDYSLWLSKEQAAHVLECSSKTVERLAARHKVTCRIWKRPAGAAITVYHPADIEKIRARRLPPQVLPKQVSAIKAAIADGVLKSNHAIVDAIIGPAPSHELSTERKEVAQIKPLTVSKLSKTRLNPFAIVPIDRKLFLTRREAAEFAGLPVSAIKAAIAAGVMPAIRTGRGIRIVREMINAIELASFLAERSSELLARGVGVAVPPGEPDLNSSTEQ